MITLFGTTITLRGVLPPIARRTFGSSRAAASAAALSASRGKVTVARGHKSRVKMLEIAGAPDVLEALVAARLDALG